jgi:urease accessory protein
MFTQSHGLERLVEAGLQGEHAIGGMIESYLLHVAGPGDALAARWVARCAAQDELNSVMSIDQRLEATKLSAEGRLASKRCGGRILQLGAQLVPDSLPSQYLPLVQSGQAPGHQSVALALLGVANGLDEHSTVLVELHSVAVSLCGAAVRLGALDHIAAQRVLLRCQPVMAAAAALGEDRDWRAIGGFAPAIEIAQFQHRSALAHMFVS